MQRSGGRAANHLGKGSGEDVMFEQNPKSRVEACPVDTRPGREGRSEKEYGASETCQESGKAWTGRGRNKAGEAVTQARTWVRLSWGHEVPDDLSVGDCVTSLSPSTSVLPSFRGSEKPSLTTPTVMFSLALDSFCNAFPCAIFRTPSW